MGHARGDIELERKVLVIKRIHVTYSGLDLDGVDDDKIQRVLDTHVDGCPVARSIQGSIEITTAIDNP